MRKRKSPLRNRKVIVSLLSGMTFAERVRALVRVTEIIYHRKQVEKERRKHE